MKNKQVRKTISLPEKVYTLAKEISFVKDQSFSAYVTETLEKALLIQSKKHMRNVRDIEFLTQDLGEPLDNLRREDYYDKDSD